MNEKIDLAEKLSGFDDHWHPRIVAELNGQQVKVAKLLGDFDWHAHADEDELFLVVKGHLVLELRDRIVELDPGQLFVVPRGVQHRPIAREEVHVVLFEPASTRNTGEHENERTLRELDWI